MEDDKLIDTTLLVATAMGRPGVAWYALYSPASEFLISVLPISIVALGVLIAVIYESGESPRVLAFAGAVLAASGWIKWVVAIGVLMYPTYKIWQAAANDSSTKITHHLFTKDGIELITASGSSVLRWSDCSRVIETAKGFLFYQGNKLATFVPSRCLEGDAELAIIRRFIRTNVAGARLLA
jgi:YcxB-like protein